MSGSFYLVMMNIKLAVGQWTLDMAATALAAAVILRVKRRRIRIERLPAAELLVEESGPETLAGEQEPEAAET